MEKIQFDAGQRSYRINGNGILRFNPGDPNLYARFMGMNQKLDMLGCLAAITISTSCLAV